MPHGHSRSPSVGASALQSAKVQRRVGGAGRAAGLANAGAAQLWACCLEAYDASEVEDVATLVAAIGAKCDTVSSALLGADLGV